MAFNNKPCQDKYSSPCLELSYSKCPHCSLDLCLEHMNTHQQLVRVQFNELIDRINEQKVLLNNSSNMIEMKVQTLKKLDQWRMRKMETIVNLYHTERTHIENVCEQGLREKLQIQTRMYEQLNTIANTIEKKKNIHPRDLEQLEKRMDELNMMIKKIQEITQTELTTIVTNMKLPEMMELEQRLNDAERTIESIRQRTMRNNYSDLRHLQKLIMEKDQEITNLRQNFQRLV